MSSTRSVYALVMDGVRYDLAHSSNSYNASQYMTLIALLGKKVERLTGSYHT